MSQNRQVMYHRGMISTKSGDPDGHTGTPTRERTRRALLNSGIAVLTTDPTASLGDIAAHAGVARSTLNRYFPDRGALTQAIDEYVDAQYCEAMDSADVDAGTGYEAFERIIDELQDRIEPFAWWMHIIHAEVDDFDSEPDRQLLSAISRGQSDGTIDDQFPARWIHTLLWTTLWTAHKEIVIEGQRPRLVLDITRRTLRKVVAPPAASRD